MKLPFFLAEHGYRPDPNNPMRFVHPDGHPFHPVTFAIDRQQSQGECVKAIAQAAYEAGMETATGLRSLNDAAEKMDDRCPAGMEYNNSAKCEIRTCRSCRQQKKKDPQCDGCRWKLSREEESLRMPSGDSHPLHCIMHRQRVENCPQQEIVHVKPEWAGLKNGLPPEPPYIGVRNVKTGEVVEIIVKDSRGDGRTRLNRREYDALCAGGMMWEFHPDAPERWPT